MGFAVLLMTQLTKDTPVPIGLAVDVHRRPGRRADVLGPHDRHPERRAVPPARRRDLQPDVLPPDRRHDRARVRRARSSARRSRTSWCRRCRPPASRRRSSTGSPGQLGGTSTSSQLTGVGDLGARSWRRPGPVPGAVEPSSRRSSRASTGPSASRPPRRSGSASPAPIIAAVAAVAIKEIPLRATQRGAGPDGRRRRRRAEARPAATPATDAD